MRAAAECNAAVKGGAEDRGYALERAVFAVARRRGRPATGDRRAIPPGEASGPAPRDPAVRRRSGRRRIRAALRPAARPAASQPRRVAVLPLLRGRGRRLAVLLALAELVSWWAVLVLPVAVAVMVKLNDVVAAIVVIRSARARCRSRNGTGFAGRSSRWSDRARCRTDPARGRRRSITAPTRCRRRPTGRRPRRPAGRPTRSDQPPVAEQVGSTRRVAADDRPTPEPTTGQRRNGRQAAIRRQRGG